MKQEKSWSTPMKVFLVILIVGFLSVGVWASVEYSGCKKMDIRQNIIENVNRIIHLNSSQQTEILEGEEFDKVIESYPIIYDLDEEQEKVLRDIVDDEFSVINEITMDDLNSIEINDVPDLEIPGREMGRW